MIPVEPKLAEARAGSTAALGELLELCRNYLLGIANKELDSRVAAKTGASDVVQDAFLEAQRIFDRFDGHSKDELFAWLRAILLNKLSDTERHFKTGKRQIGRELVLDTPLPHSDGTPSAVVGAEEEQAKVRRAVDQLPEHYRQIIIWRQWDELPFEEIAKRLGKSVDAARMTWWRALEKLEQQLGDMP